MGKGTGYLQGFAFHFVLCFKQMCLWFEKIHKQINDEQTKEKNFLNNDSKIAYERMEKVF